MSQHTHARIQFGSITFPIMQHGSICVGRSIASDLRIFEDPGVSRDHCIIKSVEGRLEVTDLDSRNSTRVNGKTISCSTELFHTDVITVGESKLTILLKQDTDPEVTEPDVPLSP